jgi:hypothetical protein
MEHNDKTHQYEWKRGLGPRYYHMRRENKHYKHIEENDNIREHLVKMHPHKRDLVMTLHFFGEPKNYPTSKQNQKHKEMDIKNNTRENGGKKRPNKRIRG